MLSDDTDEYITLINDEKERIGGREFAGSGVRCQILRTSLDPQTGETTIDVRVK